MMSPFGDYWLIPNLVSLTEDFYELDLRDV
jgi:hypothetical protein